jgi:DNA-binding NtrC family response regulator
MARPGRESYLTPDTIVRHGLCWGVRTKTRFSRFRRDPIMQSPRLLVVDDDPYTRIALNAFFTRGGWQVSLAATVAEAISLLDEDPHYLILDLDLPDGGGESVLEAVRARCRGTHVLVCSGVGDPGRLTEVKRLSPEMLMGKPIDLGTVYRLREKAMPLSA